MAAKQRSKHASFQPRRSHRFHYINSYESNVKTSSNYDNNNTNKSNRSLLLNEQKVNVLGMSCI